MASTSQSGSSRRKPEAPVRIRLQFREEGVETRSSEDIQEEDDRPAVDYEDLPEGKMLLDIQLTLDLTAAMKKLIVSPAKGGRALKSKRSTTPARMEEQSESPLVKKTPRARVVQKDLAKIESKAKVKRAATSPLIQHLMDKRRRTSTDTNSRRKSSKKIKKQQEEIEELSKLNVPANELKRLKTTDGFAYPIFSPSSLRPSLNDSGNTGASPVLSDIATPSTNIDLSPEMEKSSGKMKAGSGRPRLKKVLQGKCPLPFETFASGSDTVAPGAIASNSPVSHLAGVSELLNDTQVRATPPGGKAKRCKPRKLSLLLDADKSTELSGVAKQAGRPKILKDNVNDSADTPISTQEALELESLSLMNLDKAKQLKRKNSLKKQRQALALTDGNQVHLKMNRSGKKAVAAKEIYGVRLYKPTKGRGKKTNMKDNTVESVNDELKIVEVPKKKVKKQITETVSTEPSPLSMDANLVEMQFVEPIMGESIMTSKPKKIKKTLKQKFVSRLGGKSLGLKGKKREKHPGIDFQVKHKKTLTKGMTEKHDDAVKYSDQLTELSRLTELKRLNTTVGFRSSPDVSTDVLVRKFKQVKMSEAKAKHGKKHGKKPELPIDDEIQVGAIDEKTLNERSQDMPARGENGDISVPSGFCNAVSSSKETTDMAALVSTLNNVDIPVLDPCEGLASALDMSQFEGMVLNKHNKRRRMKTSFYRYKKRILTEMRQKRLSALYGKAHESSSVDSDNITDSLPPSSVAVLENDDIYPKDPLRKVRKRRRNVWRKGVVKKPAYVANKLCGKQQVASSQTAEQLVVLQLEESETANKVASSAPPELEASKTGLNPAKQKKFAMLRRLQTNANLANAVLDESTLKGRFLRKRPPQSISSADGKTRRERSKAWVSASGLPEGLLRQLTIEIPDEAKPKKMGRPRKLSASMPKLTPTDIDCPNSNSKPEEESFNLFGKADNKGPPDKEFVAESVDETDLHLYLSVVSDEDLSPSKESSVVSLEVNPKPQEFVPVIPTDGDTTKLDLPVDNEAPTLIISPSIIKDKDFKKTGKTKMKGKKGKPPGIPMTEEEKSRRGRKSKYSSPAVSPSLYQENDEEDDADSTMFSSQTCNLVDDQDDEDWCANLNDFEDVDDDEGLVKEKHNDRPYKPRLKLKRVIKAEPIVDSGASEKRTIPTLADATPISTSSTEVNIVQQDTDVFGESISSANLASTYTPPSKNQEDASLADGEDVSSDDCMGLKIVQVVSLSQQNESAKGDSELAECFKAVGQEHIKQTTGDTTDQGLSDQMKTSSKHKEDEPQSTQARPVAPAKEVVPDNTNNQPQAKDTEQPGSSAQIPASGHTSTSSSFACGLPLSYKCNACRVHTPDLHMMVKHFKAKHPNMRCFACPYCKATHSFISQKQLRLHVRNSHPDKIDRNEIALSEVAKKFVEAMVLPNSPECIRVGNRVVLEEDIHTCTYCQLKMTSLANVYEHLNSKHSDLFEFVCPVCQNFKSKVLSEIAIHCMQAHKSSLDTDKVHVSVPKNLLAVLTCISKGGKYIEKSLHASEGNASKSAATPAGTSSDLPPTSEAGPKAPNPQPAHQTIVDSPLSLQRTLSSISTPALVAVEPFVGSESQSIPQMTLLSQTPLIAIPIVSGSIGGIPSVSTTRPLIAFSSSLFDTSSLTSPPQLIMSSAFKPTSVIQSAAGAASFLSPSQSLQPLTKSNPTTQPSSQQPEPRKESSKSLPVLNIPTIKQGENQPSSTTPGRPSNEVSVAPSSTPAPPAAHHSSQTNIAFAPVVDDLPENEPSPDAYTIFNLRPMPQPSPTSMAPPANPFVFPPVSTPISSAFIQGQLAGFYANMVLPHNHMTL